MPVLAVDTDADVRRLLARRDKGSGTSDPEASVTVPSIRPFHSAWAPDGLGHGDLGSTYDEPRTVLWQRAERASKERFH